MKKLSPIAKYLLEMGGYSDPIPEPDPTGGQTPYVVSTKTGMAGLGDTRLFNNVVIKNPTGEAFDKKKSNFGLGFDTTPELQKNVMNLIQQHGNDDDKKDLGLTDSEEGYDWDTDDPNNPYEKFASWHQINRAVGNYVTTKSNIAMKPFQLGMVPKNPAGRYDGLNTTKVGIISDKPGRKVRNK